VPLDISVLSKGYFRRYFGPVVMTLSVGIFIMPASFLSPSPATAVTWPLERKYLEGPPAVTGPIPLPTPAHPTKTAAGIAFTLIPAGCFNMGSFDVGLVGEVCLDAFYLSQHEITNAQFRRFRPSHDSGTYQGHSLNGDQQPAVNLRWHDAVAFATWLSGATAEGFRLPTEASYAEGSDRFGKARVNPFTEIDGNPLRVRRGGSWSSTASQAHCAARDYYVGDLAVPHTGFRIVQAAPLQ
jgi:formylglycine-generating enzyme required for sulfatase activity